jgi:outer membrane protein W
MRKVSLALVILVMVASLPALAAQGDKIIRFGAVHISPTGDLTEIYDEPPYLETDTLEVDSALGGFFGFETMVTDLIGIDGTLLYGSHDVDVSIVELFDGEVVFDEHGTIGDISVMPLLISAHFHFAQRDKYDFYAGPTIGYVMLGDLEVVPDFEEADIPVKDDFGFGAVIGMDVPMGTGGWNFVWSARYLKFGAEVDEVDIKGPDTIDIDPWMILVGAGKRW